MPCRNNVDKRRFERKKEQFHGRTVQRKTDPLFRVRVLFPTAARETSKVWSSWHMIMAVDTKLHWYSLSEWSQRVLPGALQRCQIDAVFLCSTLGWTKGVDWAFFFLIQATLFPDSELKLLGDVALSGPSPQAILVVWREENRRRCTCRRYEFHTDAIYCTPSPQPSKFGTTVVWASKYRTFRIHALWPIRSKTRFFYVCLYILFFFLYRLHTYALHSIFS